MESMKTVKHIRLPLGLVSLLVCVGLAAGISDAGAVPAKEGSLDHFQRKFSYESTLFSDVQTSDWFYDSVKTAYEYGLMVGDSATTFHPNGNVTIAETVTLAARLRSIFYTGENFFEASTPWYQTYVDYALTNRIISAEYADYTREATRAEYAAILSAAFPDHALKKINQVPDNSIPDVMLSSPYGEAVYRLYRAGVLIGGDYNGTFSPDGSIRRSEVAAIVSRMANAGKRIVKDLDGPTENAALDGTGTTTEAEPSIYHPAFVLETTDAKKGAEDVAVTVALKNNPGIASVGMTVSYDNALTLKRIVYNEEIGGNYMLPPSMNNPAKLVWVSLTDVKGDLVLATLYFDVKEDAATGYHQIAAVCDADDIFDMTMSNVSFEVINGAVNITD